MTVEEMYELVVLIKRDVDRIKQWWNEDAQLVLGDAYDAIHSIENALRDYPQPANEPDLGGS